MYIREEDTTLLSRSNEQSMDGMSTQQPKEELSKRQVREHISSDSMSLQEVKALSASQKTFVDTMLNKQRYVILDLEWNMPSYRSYYTKWLECEQENKAFLSNEIIEMGAFLVDFHTAVDSKLGFRAYVQPNIWKNLYPNVEKLTQISMDKLYSKGFSFPLVWQSFLRFLRLPVLKWPCIITWSMSDASILSTNLAYYELTSPWSEGKTIDFLDLQSCFSKYILKTPRRQMSLQKALEYLAITIELPLHSAYNDAYYTYLIFLEMYRSMGDFAFAEMCKKEQKKVSVIKEKPSKKKLLRGRQHLLLREKRKNRKKLSTQVEPLNSEEILLQNFQVSDSEKEEYGSIENPWKKLQYEEMDTLPAKSKEEIAPPIFSEAWERELEEGEESARKVEAHRQVPTEVEEVVKDQGVHVLAQQEDFEEGSAKLRPAEKLTGIKLVKSGPFANLASAPLTEAEVSKEEEEASFETAQQTKDRVKKESRVSSLLEHQNTLDLKTNSEESKTLPLVPQLPIEDIFANIESLISAVSSGLDALSFDSSAIYQIATLEEEIQKKNAFQRAAQVDLPQEVSVEGKEEEKPAFALEGILEDDPKEEKQETMARLEKMKLGKKKILLEEQKLFQKAGQKKKRAALEKQRSRVSKAFQALSQLEREEYKKQDIKEKDVNIEKNENF